MLAFIFIMCYYTCKVKINKIILRRDKLMSIHNQSELLVPPKGVCLNPPRLFNLNCKDCKYFEGCTNEKKGNYKKTK